jgi:hypothetical protein
MDLFPRSAFYKYTTVLISGSLMLEHPYLEMIIHAQNAERIFAENKKILWRCFPHHIVLKQNGIV